MDLEELRARQREREEDRRFQLRRAERRARIRRQDRIINTVLVSVPSLALAIYLGHRFALFSAVFSFCSVTLTSLASFLENHKWEYAITLFGLAFIVWIIFYGLTHKDHPKQAKDTPPPEQYILTHANCIITYEPKETNFNQGKAESKLKEILAAHPSADLYKYQGALHIRILDIERHIEPPPSKADPPQTPEKPGIFIGFEKSDKDDHC